jgi:hypothetical protein
MAGETPLWRAHDLAQALQDKIEVLPGVDRAFVHIDHETTHAPVSKRLRLDPSITVVNDSFLIRSIARTHEKPVHNTVVNGIMRMPSRLTLGALTP